MAKIPVGATIAHAYRFTFGDFLTIVRGIWLPLAVQLGLTVLLTQRLIPLFRAFASKDPSAMSLLGPILLLYPLVLILFIAQIASVTKIAFGLRREVPLIDFPFGKDMWRLLGGYIVAGLAIIAALVIFALAAGLIGFLLGAMGVGKALLAVVVAMLIAVAYGAAIFMAFRFMFLLAPINIAEQNLGISRAWQLSRRNFWRSFAIVLSILIPVIILEYAVIFATIGLPPMPHGGGPDAFRAERMEWDISMMQAMVNYWYIALPLLALMTVFYMGTSCGAQVFAYRKLTEEAGSVPVTAD